MNQAFSLPELVTVIVIIGILATMGLNQYRSFVAKGRQAEAQLNLKAIADLQETYKYEKEKYHGLAQTKGVGAFATKNECRGGADEHMKNELGFRPSNCSNLRYGYWWPIGTATLLYEDAKGYAESTEREGKYIYPGCKKKDKWTLSTKIGLIEQKAGDNVIKKCE